MATGLRPDLIVRQVFRTAQPIVPASSLPAVLVGVQRQLVYRSLAGTFIGGQDNGDYSFPDLIAESAVEPPSASDAVLRPKVHLSNEYGTADVTDDATFTDLNNPATTPHFTLASGAEAVFEIATGSTGSYDSTTGKFVDPNADFLERKAAAGDVIQVGGFDAFEVTALESDDQLAVTRISHGPKDAYVSLGRKNALDVRTLTYRGTPGGTNPFPGFVSGGTKVGELVTFDGWEAKTLVGGMSYTATDDDGVRSVEFTDALNALTNGAVGQVISVTNTAGYPTPAFLLKTKTNADSGTLLNLANEIAAEQAVGTVGASESDLPARAFKVWKIFGASTAFDDSPVANASASGVASAPVSGVRTFTDAGVGDFAALSIPVVAGDWLVGVSAFATETTGITLTNGSGVGYIARTTGSFVSDGFVVDMYLYIPDATANNRVVKRVTAVTALQITVQDTWATVGGSEASQTRRIFGLDGLRPMFAVDSVATTTLTVHDLTPGLLPAAPMTALRYVILRPNAVSGGESGFADVSTQTDDGSATGDVVDDLTTGERYLEWPVAFDANTTPVEGDFVYSDDGVLLFTVTRALVLIDETVTFTATGSKIQAASSWVTRGVQVGDRIRFFNAADVGNNTTFTVASFATTSVTNDTLVVEEAVTNETNDVVTLQSVFVRDHAQAGFALPADDVLDSVGLVIRGQNQAAYSVVRVLSETQIGVRHVVAGDEVANVETKGMTTAVTVGNALANLGYSVQKTLTGAALTGDVLATFAARRTDHLDELVEVTQANVTAVAGPAVPANPIGLAALAAVNNTGVPVLFQQVASDAEADWAAALAAIKTTQVYAIAPLTQNEERLAEFRAHVATESLPENKRERILYQSRRFETQITLKTLDVAGGESALLTYYGAPLTQTIVVETTDGLAAYGVKAGGAVEGAWTGYIPGRGIVSGTLTARIVALSESGGTTTLTLLPDTAMPTTGAGGVAMTALVLKSKALSTQQLRDAIGAYPATIADRRVRNLYPDRALITFTDGTNPNDEASGFYGGGTVTDYEIGGWFMAAIAAAQRSGLPASTPLTKRPFSGVQRLMSPFGTNVYDEDVVLDGGNYLLTQPGGENSGVEAVHAVSTDTTDLSFVEDSAAPQIDNFARKLRRQITPMLGSTVLDEAFFDMFSTVQAAVVKDVVDNRELRAADLIEVREDETRADRFIASYNVRLYYPANQGDITIYI